jgi:2-amino-4-hydroxy-6-hydroxymethyldihydropteridine diphosphokinase
VTRAYVALGSNLGDRLSRLQRALDALHAEPGLRVVAVSRVYETDPVGGPVQDDYFNAVVALDADIDAVALLRVGQRLEADAARVRAERWGPRTLDVDILLFDEIHVESDELTIPHPRMWERGFVLAPLRDVAPELVPADTTWEGVRAASVELRFPWSDNNEPLP